MIRERLVHWLFTTYARCFARPALAQWNYLLMQLGLRGLGVLNYTTPTLSGERHFLQRVLLNKRSAMVMDVGANVGEYASMVREYATDARLICFEPHPNTVEKLRAKTNLRAEVIDCAVGERCGQLDLFDYADNDGSSHASVYKDVIEEIHLSRAVSHSVRVITLDEFCKSHGIDHITLLKIDTEGHELAVLAGAKRLLDNQAIDIIHFEFNEMNIISRTFLRDFRALLHNYTFYRLLPKGLIPLKNNRYDEIFAFQNIAAFMNSTIPSENRPLRR